MSELPRSDMPRIVPRYDEEDTAGHDEALELRLRVVDPESVAVLGRLEPDGEREEHALRALRIGLLALQQAAGAIDVDAVRREGDSILERMRHQLATQQQLLRERLEGKLQEYFDPQGGKFAERVQSLVAKDGELEQVLRQQVHGEDSPLQQALRRHFGPDSALMRALSPTESEGLLRRMEDTMGEALGAQRERILAQFSLDDERSALSRLVQQLRSNHENIRESLEKRVGEVIGEFSLDDDDSALSRLVRRVDEAQAQISAEFSLDQETSALARMRRQMLEVLEKHAKDDARFREAVLAGLAELKGRAAERAKGTRHGDDFEEIFFGVLQQRAQAAGDVATPTGSATGDVRHSKKGDAVVELGPDHRAAGARIVFEAKQDRGYTLARAREELVEARKNRRAMVGVFVFSRRSAPEGMQPLQRLGEDIFVVWDAEDPGSDVWLEAAIEIARALCTRATTQDARRTEGLRAIEKAAHAIENQAKLLGDITKKADTIGGAVDSIRERVRIGRKDLALRVRRLRDAVHDLQESEDAEA